MLSDVDELEFFSTLVAARTLTEAARHWGVSVSVVSRRLRSLEERLGVRLAVRGARALTLTPEGEVYRTRGTEILQQLRDLEVSISSEPGRIAGPLRVVSTVGLGRLHIAPLLREFCLAYPGVECSLELTSLPLSAVRPGYDVAVHVGPVPDSSKAMRHLVRNRRIVVASPAYLHAHGAPEHIRQLREHECLVLHENVGDACWRFLIEGREVAVPVRGSIACNDGIALTDWCLSGAGLAMRSQWHVRPYLSSGELTQVLPGVPTPAADVVAVIDAGPRVPPRVHALVDYLRAHLPDRVPPA
ncbi:MAG TPA: LysR family transcriptional regulator [Pseudonocardiaceae bacterium]